MSAAASVFALATQTLAAVNSTLRAHSPSRVPPRSFLRQDGCLPELMRFIVRPRKDFADGSDSNADAPQPDYVRRAFRSLKMLVDDPRVSGMLMDGLADHVPVAFEIFESATPEQWSMDNRDLPSLFHWSALVHTMLNARTAEFCQVFVEQNLMLSLLPWMTAPPVYETVVMLAAKALSQMDASEVLMDTLTENSALPEQMLANLKNADAAESALTFLGLLVERANKMRLSCVLFEHVFTTGVVTQLVEMAVQEGPAQSEAVELVCWLMRTGADGSLLDRHSPKNTRLFQREPMHGMSKTWAKLRQALRSHASDLADIIASSRAVSGTAGLIRLGLLELLSLLESGDTSSGQWHFLDSLHVDFWKATLSWCFDKPNSSVLHGHVYQLIFAALKTKHEGCIRGILDPDFDLAAQLRAAFELKSHRSMRGHILLIANSIRAAIDAEQLAVASTLLSDNSAWLDFQPALRREAADQLRPIDRTVDARIAPLSGLHVCPTRLFQPPPEAPTEVNYSGGSNTCRNVMPQGRSQGASCNWDSDELSQEMLGKVEADEQDRMLFDAMENEEAAAAAERDQGTGSTTCDDDSSVSSVLAACLGFGTVVPESGSRKLPTPPPAMAPMSQHQLSAQLIAQLKLSAPAAEQVGAIRPSPHYHRVVNNGGTPRLTENSHTSATTSDSDCDPVDREQSNSCLQQISAEHFESADAVAAVNGASDDSAQPQAQPHGDPAAEPHRDPAAVGLGAGLRSTPRVATSTGNASPPRLYQHTPQAPSAPMSATPRQR